MFYVCTSYAFVQRKFSLPSHKQNNGSIYQSLQTNSLSHFKFLNFKQLCKSFAQHGSLKLCFPQNIGSHEEIRQSNQHRNKGIKIHIQVQKGSMHHLQYQHMMTGKKGNPLTPSVNVHVLLDTEGICMFMYFCVVVCFHHHQSTIKLKLESALSLLSTNQSLNLTKQQTHCNGETIQENVASQLRR